MRGTKFVLNIFRGKINKQTKIDLKHCSQAKRYRVDVQALLSFSLSFSIAKCCKGYCHQPGQTYLLSKANRFDLPPTIPFSSTNGAEGRQVTYTGLAAHSLPGATFSYKETAHREMPNNYIQSDPTFMYTWHPVHLYMMRFPPSCHALATKKDWGIQHMQEMCRWSLHRCRLWGACCLPPAHSPDHRHLNFIPSMVAYLGTTHFLQNLCPVTGANTVHIYHDTGHTPKEYRRQDPAWY